MALLNEVKCLHFNTCEVKNLAACAGKQPIMHLFVVEPVITGDDEEADRDMTTGAR